MYDPFCRRSFTHTHIHLQNRVGSWEFAQAQGNHTIPAPALSILPTLDPVADWVVAARLLKSGEHVPKLTTEVRIHLTLLHIMAADPK